jgi:prophage DNA circulation protein
MARLSVSRLAGWTVTAAVAVLMMLTAGCGSSSGSSAASTPSPAASTPSPASSTTATANALICQDVDALRTSLTNLTHVKVGSGASAALSANLKDAKAKLDTLADDAGSQWNGQISGLKTALSALEKAVTGLGNGSSSVTNVVTTLGGVKNSAQDLLTAAGHRCPSPSPSASG